MKLLVAIVTYNAENYIQACIDSIKSKLHNVSVYIFDNNSTDATQDILSKMKDVIIIKSKLNLGFGAANNMMMKYAVKNNFDCIFLMNQDTYFFDNGLDNLLNYSSHNEYHIISPIHYQKDQKTLDAGFYKYQKNEKLEENRYKFINAAAWLIPIRTIRKVGFFNPLFFHYGEDRDYANRLLYHQGYFEINVRSKIVHDRSHHQIEDQYFLNIDKYFKRVKIYYLSILTNTNKSLLQCLIDLHKSVAKNTIDIISNKDIQNMPKLLKIYLTLLFILPLIIRSRKESKMDFAFNPDKKSV